mmetsp:Transcript_22280/g.63165  ORF Transcript_22280/g.63165 Transcript_22280/m.63165 type:complete len:269 (+) Transcript_22280:653-1459(+)
MRCNPMQPGGLEELASGVLVDRFHHRRPDVLLGGGRSGAVRHIPNQVVVVGDGRCVEVLDPFCGLRDAGQPLVEMAEAEVGLGGPCGGVEDDAGVGPQQLDLLDDQGDSGVDAAEGTQVFDVVRSDGDPPDLGVQRVRNVPVFQFEQETRTPLAVRANVNPVDLLQHARCPSPFQQRLSQEDDVHIFVFAVAAAVLNGELVRHRLRCGIVQVVLPLGQGFSRSLVVGIERLRWVLAHAFLLRSACGFVHCAHAVEACVLLHCQVHCFV